MASLVKRSRTFYAQYYLGRRLCRVSLHTDSLQIAKEKLRQLESSLAREEGPGLPTRTPIAQVVQAYTEHIRTIKTAKSAQTDVYYLREAFGPVCPGLQVTSRRQSPKARKRPLLPGATQDLRRRARIIEAPSFEQISTADVAAFISGQVQQRGLAPKTANRYREILCRLRGERLFCTAARVCLHLGRLAKGAAAAGAAVSLCGAHVAPAAEVG